MLATVPFWSPTDLRPPVVARPQRRIPAVAALAERMLIELQTHRLSVSLVPDRQYAGYGNDFRRLRCAEEQNAPWYREFCGRYESRRRGCFRKFKTRIKRRATERALERLLRGATASPYEERLLDLIADLRHDPDLRRRLLPCR